jgi:glutamyl-Q tRNA(Asp) synthetase
VAAGRQHAWRLDMAAALAGVPPLSFIDGDQVVACAPAGFGDVVLARRDAPASYHLCVTHDDAAQGITLVTRGADLRPATHVHVLIQHLMGWPTPRYFHHPLALGPDGARLAKRDGAASLRGLRAAGLGAEAVLDLARAAAWQGIS